MAQFSQNLNVIIHEMPYFRGAHEPVVNTLATQAIRRAFASGEMILTEGEPCPGIWLIESGRVKVFKLNPDGGEHVLLILGENDTFNDIPTFDGGTNPANAAALSDVTLWLLPVNAVQMAIAQDIRIAQNIIRALSARVRGLVGQIENLALYSVLTRLARFLLRQLDEAALSGPGVTRTTIAAHLATTPQTISTALKALEEMGAIEFNRHEVLIVREELLRSIAMLD